MLIRRKRLKRASYNKVYFFLEANETQVAKRIVRYEYPNRDVPSTLDLGRKTKQWRVEGFIAGAHYQKDRELLIAELERSAPGKLMHPYLGLLDVRCEGFRVLENNIGGGFVRFEMDFCEVGGFDPIIRKRLDLPGGDLSKSTSKAIIDDILGLVTKGTEDLNNFADEINRTTEKIEDVFSELAEFRSAAANVHAAAQDFKGSLKNALSEPVNFLNTFLSVLDIIFLSEIQPQMVVELLGLTPSEIPQVDALVATKATDWANHQDLDRASDQEKLKTAILDRLEEVINAPGLSNPLTDQLEAVRVDFIQRSQAKSEMNRSKTITLERPTCSLLLAYQLYGDITREAAILERNSVPTPSLLMSGTTLEVMGHA